MQIISLEELLQKQTTYITLARTGKLFVYPTDTIYGIGSIVSSTTINKIDIAKQRLGGKYYSIIAPHFDWIKTYFNISKNIEQQRHDRQQQFPGRGLTLLLPLLEKPHINPLLKKEGVHFHFLSQNNLIGVRYLGNHPFQIFIERLGEPFITTSCNISGTVPIIKVDTIPSVLQKHVDICIDGGVLDGQPSVVINYKDGEVIRI